jgi:hypothetical protein
VVGSVVDQPLLIAAAGLVVVLAILLVFVMVLRSGGKKSSIGIGYDAQQGPIGQPKAPPSQPGLYGSRGTSGQGWPQSNGYGPGASPSGAAQGGWGAAYQNQWNEPAAAAQPYQAPQAPSWAPAGTSAQAGQWQDQGGWGQPQGGQPAMQGNWGSPSTQPAGPGGWGQPQAQTPGAWGQPADQGAGWGAPAAPSQPSYGGAAPRGGGWTGGMAQGPEADPAYGQPAYGQPAYGDVARPVAGRSASPDRGAVLTVRQGNDVGRTYEVRKDRMTIGRSRESDIFLEDLAVSRTHTSIGRDERGRYIVRDENSANGTFVNNQRVTEQVLQDGDEIQIGTTVLAFSRR